MAPTFNGKPGDLIEISHLTYQHWAVYIGENEVVHLVNDGVQSSGWMASLSSSSSSSGSHGKVKREKFTEVVGSDHYQVNNLLDNRHTARDPSIIVEEACKMVGPKQYNLATYNCEHFATEMRYGVAVSRQVIVVVAGAAGVTGITAAAGAGALVAGPPGAAVGAASWLAGGTVAFCKALIRSRSSS